jgi:hypothetical protein
MDLHETRCQVSKGDALLEGISRELLMDGADALRCKESHPRRGGEASRLAESLTLAIKQPKV